MKASRGPNALFVRQAHMVPPRARSLLARIVRDYVFAALDHQRAEIENFIGEHVAFSSEAVRVLTGPIAAVFREVRFLRISPQFDGDFPAVDVVMVTSVVLIARTKERDTDLGVRGTLADVEVHALGTPAGRGHRLTLDLHLVRPTIASLTSIPEWLPS